MLKPRQSSRHPAQYLTDLDFADDLGFIAQSIHDAEYLLQALEQAANQVGLHCNESKMEYTSTSPDPYDLKSLNGSSIKRVEDFKYLGSRITDSQKDFNIRKALAWDACNKLDKIWCSNLPSILKIQTFQTLIEPILLYGSETWTLPVRLERRLDGAYTNLLRRIQNISWRSHATLETIY